MNIGWYPGHMHKARKDITKAIKSCDAVIEIVDARLPFSSENPLLNSIIGSTPRLRLLNKADLADPVLTTRWLDYFSAQGISRTLALDKSESGRIRNLPRECQQHFGTAGKLFRLMIVGIPNVGKSTILNLMLNRKVAKTGNEPAVTKARQEIKLAENLLLLDTPGILWPKFEDPLAGYRLAASGAIRNTAFEFADVAVWTIELLARRYPVLISARYGLDEIHLNGLDMLESLGRKRGCLTRGGVDLNKAGEVLLNDLRSGKIGRISLESPEDIPLESDQCPAEHQAG